MGMVEEGAGTSAAGRRQGRRRRLAGVAGMVGAVLLAAACMPALDPGSAAATAW